MPVCPMCGTKVDMDKQNETYTSQFNGQEYKKYSCPNCGLHWWEPLGIVGVSLGTFFAYLMLCGLGYLILKKMAYNICS